ncbi:MAG: RNA polymerase sigma factor [Archangiaceae bacterium]|nr:RNA polymerase sigma factor [Archangiaceae bacterium]
MTTRGAAVARFETVYRSEVNGVWRFLYRLGVRPPTTEDLTHQTFLVAFQRWPTLDAARPVGPWLRGIAWRVAADHRRLHQHREASLDELPESHGTGSAPADEVLAARRALVALEQALEQINPEQRAVFVMHELESMAIDEIAAAMEAPVPTIYSRLRLARERLSALLLPHRVGDPA